MDRRRRLRPSSWWWARHQPLPWAAAVMQRRHSWQPPVVSALARCCVALLCASRVVTRCVELVQLAVAVSTSTLSPSRCQVGPSKPRTAAQLPRHRRLTRNSWLRHKPVASCACKARCRQQKTRVGFALARMAPPWLTVLMTAVPAVTSRMRFTRRLWSRRCWTNHRASHPRWRPRPRRSCCRCLRMVTTVTWRRRQVGRTWILCSPPSHPAS